MDNSLQLHQPDADPAAAAFARLTEEVGVVRRLVAANDNSATLGEIVQRLDRMVDAINTLARRPAMKLTPDSMAEQIVAAALKARAEDHAALAQAKERMEKAVRLIEAQTGKVATIRQQRRRFAWTGGGGLLAGVLLWSFLPGTLARATPASWHWPERMARHVIGEANLSQAGVRMMRADDPDTWRGIIEATRLWRANERMIDACKRLATAKHGPVSCNISIRPM